MKFSTLIKRKWWNEKLKDEQEHGFFIEYKEDNEYWGKRLSRLCWPVNHDQKPVDAVFLVGSEVHRRKVVELDHVRVEEIPAKYQPAISTPYCWYLKCVKEGDA